MGCGPPVTYAIQEHGRAEAQVRRPEPEKHTMVCALPDGRRMRATEARPAMAGPLRARSRRVTTRTRRTRVSLKHPSMGGRAAPRSPGEQAKYSKSIEGST